METAFTLMAAAALLALSVALAAFWGAMLLFVRVLQRLGL